MVDWLLVLFGVRAQLAQVELILGLKVCRNDVVQLGQAKWVGRGSHGDIRVDEGTGNGHSLHKFGGVEDGEHREEHDRAENGEFDLSGDFFF